MKKLMCSQPMANLSQEEICKARRAYEFFCDTRGYEQLNTYIAYDPCIGKVIGAGGQGFVYLVKSLEFLSEADGLFMCDGWENARGCVVEHNAAKMYDIPIFYQETEVPWMR